MFAARENGENRADFAQALQLLDVNEAPNHAGFGKTRATRARARFGRSLVSGRLWRSGIA
jgi:hypothetical protein